MQLSRLASILVAFSIVLGTRSSQAQTYVLTDLGALAGGNSCALGLSSAGIVAGTYGPPGSTGPCIWTPSASGMTFTPLSSPASAGYMVAYGVNDAAQVAATGGSPWGSIQGGGSWENGFLWSGSWQDLTSKTKQSEALAINALGSVAGWSSTSSTGAALWKRGKLYSIPSGTMAHGINDYGQVVGSASVGTALVPFLWTPSAANGATGTTTLLPLSRGVARGINAAGDVVGGTDSGPGAAFIWDHATNAVTFLGALPGMATSTAGKVNRAKWVVGVSSTADESVSHGFLWDPVNGMRDLNSLTVTGGIPSGWVLSCAYWRALMATLIPMVSINDAGQIAGTATVTVGGSTTTHAFLLTPQ